MSTDPQFDQYNMGGNDSAAATQDYSNIDHNDSLAAAAAWDPSSSELNLLRSTLSKHFRGKGMGDPNNMSEIPQENWRP